MRERLYVHPVFRTEMSYWYSMKLCMEVDHKHIYEVQSKSNAYIFIVTVQELLLQPR